jgi:hypothetical protein
MLDGSGFERKWEAQGRKGESEHAIYFDAAAERWLKVNNKSNHGNWLEYFHRLALHCWLFPAAPLRFEGLMILDRELQPVVSQAHVVAVRGACQQEVDQLMLRLGFDPIRLINPSRQYDYINRSIGVEVNDLHDENVLVNEAGNLAVIDPVPMMEQESKIRRLSKAGE